MKKNLFSKLFFLVFLGLLLFYYIFPWKELNIKIPFSGDKYKLGLDLQGGVELDYKVDLSEAKKEKDFNKEKELSIIEGLKSIIDKRIETLKINDSIIFTADYAGDKHIIVQIPLKGNNKNQDEENIQKAKKAIGKVVRIKFKQRNPKYTGSGSKQPEWILAKGRGSDGELHTLDERYFVKSAVQFDQLGKPAIELVFNEEGKKIFGDLSTRLVGKEMAIFVGGEMLTHPWIREPILGGKAQITGGYTREEAIKLSQDINTGVVPAPIYLSSEKSINSKLGLNSLNRLIFSGFIGFLFIFIFLIYIYRLSGFVSSIALIMYITIVLALVKTFGIVLTLASIAGLILSVGMAIDANVLIFERIIEEIKNGKKLDKATEIGFKKSWSAIWDSNITGLIVALILYIFGVNMIKGFGLMLGIGIVVSLFSAMYISRVFVLLIAKTGINKKLFIGK